MSCILDKNTHLFCPTTGIQRNPPKKTAERTQPLLEVKLSELFSKLFSKKEIPQKLTTTFIGMYEHSQSPILRDDEAGSRTQLSLSILCDYSD